MKTSAAFLLLLATHAHAFFPSLFGTEQNEAAKVFAEEEQALDGNKPDSSTAFLQEERSLESNEIALSNDKRKLYGGYDGYGGGYDGYDSDGYGYGGYGKKGTGKKGGYGGYGGYGKKGGYSPDGYSGKKGGYGPGGYGPGGYGPGGYGPGGYGPGGYGPGGYGPGGYGPGGYGPGGYGPDGYTGGKKGGYGPGGYYGGKKGGYGPGGYGPDGYTGGKKGGYGPGGYGPDGYSGGKKGGYGPDGYTGGKKGGYGGDGPDGYTGGKKGGYGLDGYSGGKKGGGGGYCSLYPYSPYCQLPGLGGGLFPRPGVGFPTYISVVYIQYFIVGGGFRPGFRPRRFCRLYPFHPYCDDGPGGGKKGGDGYGPGGKKGGDGYGPGGKKGGDGYGPGGKKGGDGYGPGGKKGGGCGGRGLTMTETLARDDRFSILVAALDAADLLDFFDDDCDALTLFAPTNAAFLKLPDGTIEALLDDIPTLTLILTSHVLEGVTSSSDLAGLVDQSPLSVSAVSTETLTIYIETNPLQISVTGGGNTMPIPDVVIPDIYASNGLIHGIDYVILPESLGPAPTPSPPTPSGKKGGGGGKKGGSGGKKGGDGYGPGGKKGGDGYDGGIGKKGPIAKGYSPPVYYGN